MLPTAPVETPPQVEFEHRRLKPGVVPPALVEAHQKAGELGQRMSSRAKLWRAVFVVTGAALIAFGSQRMGMELQGGLCLFIAALPILWVGGWLFGFLFSFMLHARKAKGHIQARVGSMNWQDELVKHSVMERVKMVVLADGLELHRDAEKQVVPWAAIKLDRVDAKTVAVYLLNETSGLALNEAIPVPRSAFASDEAFDAFCLEAQKHVWEAQRK